MSTLRLFGNLAPEVRDKYAGDYARKLAPSYRLRFPAPARCSCDRYHGPDPRGLYVPAVRRHGRVVSKAHWLFSGWQFDQAIADAFADHVGGNLGALIRLTPAHNKIIADNPPTETQNGH